MGVGGYCLTKDPLFASFSSNEYFKRKVNFKFSNLAVKTNNLMPKFSCEKISNENKNLKGKKF